MNLNLFSYSSGKQELNKFIEFIDFTQEKEFTIQTENAIEEKHSRILDLSKYY